MVHYFVVMDGQRKYTDELVTYLLKSQYTTQLPNHPGLFVQPNVREIRFFDISVFESSEGLLLKDLEPYGLGGSEIKGRLSFLINSFRKVMGLEPVPPSVGKRQAPRSPSWRDHINISIIGKKKDKWINGVEML